MKNDTDYCLNGKKENDFQLIAIYCTIMSSLIVAQNKVLGHTYYYIVLRYYYYL